MYRCLLHIICCLYTPTPLILPFSLSLSLLQNFFFSFLWMLLSSSSSPSLSSTFWASCLTSSSMFSTEWDIKCVHNHMKYMCIRPKRHIQMYAMNVANEVHHILLYIYIYIFRHVWCMCGWVSQSTLSISNGHRDALF